MKLTFRHIPHQGLMNVSIDAKGYLAAVLHWADERGPLPGWTSLAVIPLDVYGQGRFTLPGFRAIPPGATHIAARLLRMEGGCGETVMTALRPAAPMPDAPPQATIGVMSDLHLSGKDWRIRSALRLMQDVDCVLLAGDMTNDGLPEQMARFRRCIDEELPGVPVLAVTGNHDLPQRPLPLVFTGTDDHPLLQAYLLERAAALGLNIQADASGAYRADVAGLSIFGLNAISHFRRFTFPEGRQLDWLGDQLRARETGRSIVLCHAPLHAHHPNATDKSAPPYLSMDKRLQQIINESGRICFIAGHTHVSLSDLTGCAEHDPARSNIYYNDGSVTLTTLRTPEAMGDPDWTDGVVTRLEIYPQALHICPVSSPSGRRIARGHYRFPWP